MRVLVLTQFLEPEPLPKAMDVARALKARGHEVTILTGLPNYPTGRLYPGYRLRLIQREEREGIPVIRTILYPSHGTSLFGRVVNYGSFMISAVFGAMFTPPCDVIYVWHPPLTVGVSAWLIGAIKSAPFVYDVQDIWPDSGIWSGMLKEGLLVRALRVLERFVYARAAHLLTVTEGARQDIISKGCDPQDVSVVSQLIDEDQFGAPDARRAAEIRRELGLAGKFVVEFAGNIGLVQGLDVVLSAAERLGPDSRVAFVIVGDGADCGRLKRLAVQKGLKSVHFIGRRPLAEMPDYMAAADVMLLSLTYSRICELSIPLKTFAYLAAGKPIVAAIRGAAAELIGKAEAGIVVTPESGEELAEAVSRMANLPADELRRLGESGRRHMVTHHAKEKMLDYHVEIISRAADARARLPEQV